MGRARLKLARSARRANRRPRARRRTLVVYCFGDYALDVDARELRRSGAPVAVEPRVFDLLRQLIEQRHRVVGKDELRASLWSDVVVGDGAIQRCVWAARRALGDDARRQGSIHTVHGRGYRFVAPVRLRDGASADESASA